MFEEACARHAEYFRDREQDLDERDQHSKSLSEESTAQSKVAQAHAQEIKQAVRALRPDQTHARVTEDYVHYEVKEQGDSLKSYLLEHDAAMKQAASQQEEINHVMAAAQEAKAVAAEELRSEISLLRP